MTDIYSRHEGKGMQQHQQSQGYYNQGYYQQHQQNWGDSRAHQIAKAATSATAGATLLLLSGLTLAGTIISLILATPVLVIFSPVLVPAVITVFMLGTGFLTSGGLGVAAITVLTWLYRYLANKHPAGADSYDDLSHKLGSKARDLSDKREYDAGLGGHYGGTGGAAHAGIGIGGRHAGIGAGTGTDHY